MRLAKIGETYVMARPLRAGWWEVREHGILRDVNVRRVVWRGFPGAKLPELVLA